MTRTFALVASAALLALVASACTSYQPGRIYNMDGSPISSDELDTLRKRRAESAAVRAAFDLGCAREALRSTCLVKDTNDLCLTTGVEGCGRRATYVWTATGVQASQWVMDASSKTLAPNAPHAPDAP